MAETKHTPGPWSPDRPDRDGWWEWMESGERKPELVLLSGDGETVADDDEWERATGEDANPTNGTTPNYWEGTDTTQDQMPGLWRYAGQAAKAEGRTP